jgi:sugar lactone lactonase YvrE
MPSTESSVPELEILIGGIAFGEQPRWHEGRLWFSLGPPEVIAVDLEGNSEVILQAPSFAQCGKYDARILACETIIVGAC